MDSIKAVSLFSGAGGMDVGFTNAGYSVCYANEKENTFCDTYEAFFGEGTISRGDIDTKMDEISKLKDVDVVFGGPPCQGFSVAGKMDPNDPRSQLIWSYLAVVELLKPKVFVMENVRALGKLEKWSSVREAILKKASDMGYSCFYTILNAVDYGVPQKRERVFFIGVHGEEASKSDFINALDQLREKPKTVREVFAEFDPIGTGDNPNTCPAYVTLASNPVMRKSPYAGMLLNGQGRSVNLDDYSQTLAASMGGNKTPVIDQYALEHPGEENWIETYHRGIVDGSITPKFGPAPDRLRRLSITEAAALQTFPKNYPFQGSSAKKYTQIGNAVPCHLAEVVALTVKKLYL